MENLHKLWKDRVAAHRPSNKKELKRFIKQEFFNFSAEEIENLVKSVPKRPLQITEAKGGHIPY